MLVESILGLLLVVLGDRIEIRATVLLEDLLLTAELQRHARFVEVVSVYIISLLDWSHANVGVTRRWFSWQRWLAVIPTGTSVVSKVLLWIFIVFQNVVQQVVKFP